MKKIAFVGVGRMGANMARHLQLDCGYEVTAVSDVNQEAAQSLAEELNAQVAGSLAEVTAAADIIFTVVTNDEAMRGIFKGEDNLLTGAEGKTFINCATLSPGVHQEVYEAGKAAGAEVLEAAMASSISQAREGKLYLMIGGEESAFEANKKLLEDLSVNLRYCGEIGRAAQVKALVNMVMNINTAGLAEGLGLADALGLDLDMVREVFSQTGANSRVLETDSEDMVARDHDCWFSAEHAAKDSGIAADLAVAAGLNLPVNNATRAQYDAMVAKGLGDLDKSGIAELTFKGRG
ncbi:NAD(P)-dependent oxidoreductase [Roseibacillus ishigakijimensis]|uniref:NAD(P)-dependent oxidoreductase n=1 Tax=Roseibacillus ishigakijimensis TaxID=454146 RepID=A0A934RV80_9BACT|nr:NAD(P)-dependent oxidoreductase [Roseibacillus ishigakijimensis]MBK1834780.1 NAD(P)-dependent oxidoreductase [Roseibacillus ishigakijimensis]